MRVDVIEVICLAAPVERPVTSAVGRMTTRPALLVQVTDEAGQTGLGEVWVNFPPWGLAERRVTLEAGIIPLVVGRRLETPLELWAQLRAPLERLGRQCGNMGLLYQTLSGIEIALWDLLGKRRSQPVHALLRELVLAGAAPGTAKHEAQAPPHRAPQRPADRPARLADGARASALDLSVPIYASGLGPPDAEALARQHAEIGVRAFKLKLGLDRAEDRRRLANLRRAIGADADLMVDANQGWSEDETRAWFGPLRDADVRWLEEPIACDDYDGLARLVAESPIPIAAGENVYAPSGWQQLSAAGVQIVQPDACKCGGLSEALRAAVQAEAQGRTAVPHYLGGGVGLVATMHLLVALGTAAPLELDANPNPLRTTLTHPAPTLRDGRLHLPAGPGLGIALNEATTARFRT